MGKHLNGSGGRAGESGPALTAAVANGDRYYPGKCRKHGDTVFYVFKTASTKLGFKSKCYPCHRERDWGRRGIQCTWDEYCALAREQLGRCAACGSTADDLDVDHCHAGGHVRGLLCNDCNISEGRLRTPERARALADYMEKYK